MEHTRSTLEADERRQLADTALAAIEQGLGLAPRSPPRPADFPATLQTPGASFVTLTRRADLRGCCGSLEPHRPLVVDVWHCARASAFDDPRFAPLAVDEWPSIEIEIAVISPLERLAARSEPELLAALEPGRHGLVLACGGRRATFLPKVWQQLPGRHEFLAQLKRKAGWSAGFWAEDLEAYRYEVEAFAVERRSSE